MDIAVVCWRPHGRMVKRMALSISRRKVLGILASLLAAFVIANLVSLHFQSHDGFAGGLRIVLGGGRGELGNFAGWGFRQGRQLMAMLAQ